MSKEVRFRLPDETIARLERSARRLGKKPSEAAAQLLDERLREIEFAFIEFRDSAVGRQAYMKGSSLAVWEVMMIAEAYDMDPAKTATHSEWKEVKVRAAMSYADVYNDEIQSALEENRSITPDILKRSVPNLQMVVTSAHSDEVPAGKH